MIGDDERPLSDVAVALRNGDRIVRDKTNADGLCRFEGIEPNAEPRIGLFELDGAAWELVTTLPLKSELAVGGAPATFPDPAPPDEDPPGEHVAKRSECLLRIAYERGFLPDTIWSFGPNRGIWGRHHRKAVLPVDLGIQVPAKRRRWIDGVRGHLHVIHRIGVPVLMALRVLDGVGRPCTSAPYVLRLVRDGGEPLAHRAGETDIDGFVRAAIPPDVVRGSLVIAPSRGAARWTIDLDVGTLLPADDPAGAAARLWNLGYRTFAPDGVWPTLDPVTAFRSDSEEHRESPEDAIAEALETLHLG